MFRSETDADGDCLTALLSSICSRDPAALGELYNLTVRQTYTLAFSILRSRHDAEEVVGDVYLHIWAHAPKFSAERGSVRAWLRTMTRNRSIDFLRRRRFTLSLEDTEAGRAIELCVCSSPLPQDWLERSEDEGAIRQALSLLPPGRRALLELAFFQGLSHQQIANTTNVPLGTVKSNLRRTLATLQRSLKVQGMRIPLLVPTAASSENLAEPHARWARDRPAEGANAVGRAPN